MPGCYTAINSTKAAIITDLLNIGTSPFTCCMWVRITVAAASYRGVISSQDGVGSGGITLMQRSNSKFALWNGGTMTDGNSFSLDTWYFVAYSLDNVIAGNLRLYQGTTPSNLTNSATAIFTSLSAGKVVFGGYHSPDSNWMDGQIAHCHLYNTNLSLSQLQEIMVRPGSLTLNGALKGYFPMTGATPVTNLTGLTNATENATMTASELGAPVFFPTLLS
jgi:hypothetical protein